MASFADPSDLITYYDGRQVRQLASDTGTPILAGSEDTNTVLLTMLARATETILQYARVGKKYSETELQALADSTTSGASITGLCCDLAYGYLTMRRGTAASDIDRLSPNFRAAQVTLQLLAAGELVFPRLDGALHEDAGTPRTADLTTQITSPSPACSWSQTANQRLIPNSPLTRNPYGQSGEDWLP